MSVLTVVNIILHLNLPSFDRPFREKVYFSIAMFPILIPILGFLFGLLFALVPYRNLPYGAKYLRAALITMIALQVVMMAAEGIMYNG